MHCLHQTGQCGWALLAWPPSCAYNQQTGYDLILYPCVPDYARPDADGLHNLCGMHQPETELAVSGWLVVGWVAPGKRSVPQTTWYVGQVLSKAQSRHLSHDGGLVCRQLVDCGISLLLDSHLANIQQFLLKVCQMRFPRNSIRSENSHKIPLTQDSDLTPNLPEIPPCVWCTTEWHHTNTKQKFCLLVWMTQSHAMSNFCPFPARCLQDNVAASTPRASSLSQ